MIVVVTEPWPPTCTVCGKPLVGLGAGPNDAPYLFSDPADWQCMDCRVSEMVDRVMEAGWEALRRLRVEQASGREG